MRRLVTATPRLRVTTWVPDDLSDLLRLHGDPEVMRFMTSGVETPEQTRARLETFLAEQEAPGWTRWRVEDDAGRLVGRAGFRSARDPGRRELGYLLARELWGHGHATELARALVGWHDDHPAAGVDPRAVAVVYSGHDASRAVLNRTGFRLVGPDPDDPDLLRYEQGTVVTRR